jgi:hypothetical protein
LVTITATDRRLEILGLVNLDPAAARVLLADYESNVSAKDERRLVCIVERAAEQAALRIDDDELRITIALASKHPPVILARAVLAQHEDEEDFRFLTGLATLLRRPEEHAEYALFDGKVKARK